MPDAPPLYYVTPEWDKDGRLTRHSLVWNPFDGQHDDVEKWWRWGTPFQEHRPLAKQWKRPAMLLQRGKQDADFVRAGQLFAIKPAAWRAIQDLVGGDAEVLPVDVTRQYELEKFTFPVIPVKQRPEYLLLHGLSILPMRHGQSGSWDLKKKRFDMTFGRFYGAPPEAQKVLWLDPAEFAGKHLFLLDKHWVASEEFVERVRAKKLTGLVFNPIEYEVKSQRTQPKLKTMPEPPRPDFAAARGGFSPALAKQWRALWDWTVAAMKNRLWKPRPPKITPPVKQEKVKAFESKNGITLPRDYFDVVTRFSSSVTLDLGWIEPDSPQYEARREIESRLRELMFGSKVELWSFDFTAKEFADFKNWGDSQVEMEPEDEYYQHFLNKLPVVRIGNGDYIALDLKTGVPTYISHDGNEDLQGKPLGVNFVDFITRWSWAGVPWPDILPATAFYDQRAKTLAEKSPALKLWHTWLRGLPLPAEGAKR